MAGNNTDLIFPDGNINNLSADRVELSAAPEIISNELSGLRGDALLTYALTLSLRSKNGSWLAREYTDNEKLANFAKHKPNRERFKPDCCTGPGPGCWVEYGPPAMHHKSQCAGCGGIPKPAL